MDRDIFNRREQSQHLNGTGAGDAVIGITVPPLPFRFLGVGTYLFNCKQFQATAVQLGELIHSQFPRHNKGHTVLEGGHPCDSTYLFNYQCRLLRHHGLFTNCKSKGHLRLVSRQSFYTNTIFQVAINLPSLVEHQHDCSCPSLD